MRIGTFQIDHGACMFCCCFLNNCIVPLGFLPWEIWAAFPGERQLQQNCPTEPTAHAGCFSVFHVHSHGLPNGWMNEVGIKADLPYLIFSTLKPRSLYMCILLINKLEHFYIRTTRFFFPFLSRLTWTRRATADIQNGNIYIYIWARDKRMCYCLLSTL